MSQSPMRPPASQCDVKTAAALVADALEHDVHSVPDVIVQQLMGGLVRAYAGRNMEAESQGIGPEGGIQPFVPNAPVTATEVLITVSGMLEAVRLNLFELGMWQHIGRFQVSHDPLSSP